jgi:hypothetical protein
MRKETLDKLTSGEKQDLCILINEDASSEIFADLETLPFFTSEYVYQLVREEAKSYPALKKLEYKLYNS